ncbi:MAG: nuclear transport factor 2 family protein [Novosphingobium sp.]
MAVDIAGAIRAAEQTRCTAMLACDLAALDTLLDPRLQFHHATGAVDGKVAYLTKVSGGRIEYVAIQWEEELVTALGPDAALLTGRMTTDVRVDGTQKRLNNRVMMAWTKDNDTWRLVAFQSTPIAG